jgi:glycerol-3-phosphate dehydrogenase
METIMSVAKSRETALEALRKRNEITALIVGGGVNGASVLRELALQGIDALLIDRGDFSAGASSAPSRMIHGGLRYLENGEFRLVRESLRERNLLLKNAPHYVKPLPTTVPVFSWLSGLLSATVRFLGISKPATTRGALLIKLGLVLYDMLVWRSRALPRHYFTSRKKAVVSRPQLNPNIVCTATYFDAWISYPERLCLELIQDAECIDDRATALNYVSFQGGYGDTVQLRDELTGEVLTIKPRLLVNATGAWIDLINHSLQYETSFIGGTKGSHLIIENAELYASVRNEMVFYENTDNRICVMFPLLSKVLVGSTDIPVNHPDEATTTDEDIAYILESISYIFPKIRIDRSEIVFHFCGVRPLPRQNASTPGQISRDHSCRIIEASDTLHFPVYSMIGGKWTTFRAFAEQVVDEMLGYLKQVRIANSADLAIGGGKNFPKTKAALTTWLEEWQSRTQLPTSRLVNLLNRYGSKAERIADFLCTGADRPLDHHPHYSYREIEFLIDMEQVMRLDDLVLRRTTLALQNELTMPLLEELSVLVAARRKWSATERQAELSRALALLSTRHGVNLTTSEGAY